MKKIIYILALATAFAACNSETLNDIYDGIPDKPYAKTGIEYTLTDADYTAIKGVADIDADDEAVREAMAADVEASKALNSFATPNAYVPAVLANNFYGLEKGSAIMVTYNYKDDVPEYLALLGAATAYTLTADDYASAGLTNSNFTPSTSAASSLPAILAANNPEAEEGDIFVVSYKTADEEGGISPTRLSEDFEGYTNTSSPYTAWAESGWTHIVTEGDDSEYWQIRLYSNNKYGQVTANGGAEAVLEAYAISPVIDLTQTTDNIFSFNVCVGYWRHVGLSVLITDDAACLTTPESVAWTDVTSNFTIPTEPTGGYGVLAPAGELNLDTDWAGKQIYIAFKYKGDDTFEESDDDLTTTYQIDNVLVKGTAPGGGGDVPTRDENAIYTFNGTAWVLYENAIALQGSDYTAMGTASLTAEQAQSYLPIYMNNNHPYAMEGDIVAVVYKTASANSAMELVFTDGKWVSNTNITKTSAQFIHSGEGWLFDPTINFTMTPADHQLVVDYVLNDPILGIFRSSYTNEEFYYGFNAHYSNISLRLSYRLTYAATDPELLDKTDEEKIVVLWNRLKNEGMPKLLELKYPNATVDVQGIPVMYNVTADIYYPDGVTYQSGTDKFPYTFTYKVLTNGSDGVPPTFEFVDVVTDTGKPIF